MSPTEILEVIYAEYRRDKEFSTLRTAGNPFVPGEGVTDGTLAMFIGEAPGRSEAAQRRPFCGRSGRLLDRLAGDVGITRETNAFITNTVKYRPPGNRDPYPEEVENSKKYVGREVLAIEPRVVVLLGRFALTLVNPRGSIGRDHGRPFDLKGRTYFPMYHPAVGLYNPTLIEDMEKDFAVLYNLVATV